MYNVCNNNQYARRIYMGRIESVYYRFGHSSVTQSVYMGSVSIPPESQTPFTIDSNSYLFGEMRLKLKIQILERNIDLKTISMSSHIAPSKFTQKQIFFKKIKLKNKVFFKNSIVCLSIRTRSAQKCIIQKENKNCIYHQHRQ